MKEPVNITICLAMALWMSCKTATAPQPAECGAGSLPCEDNITECCEVICPELHHHCGDFLTECCLDTTSHNFIWEIDTLGGHNSYLNDVAIIDENNIWAVGDIRTDSGRFNLAKWNGDRWDLHLFGVAGVTGDGIHVFSENDVWVATGIIYHWNNGTWERYHLWDMGVLGPNDGGVTKVWGSSPEDMWFVGSGGSIVHYDGSGFTRLESGTDIPLTDVLGIRDNNGEVHVWACGSGDHNESVVLKITDQTVETIYERYVGGANSLDDETIMSPMGETLWATPSSPLLWIAGGFGIFTFNDNQAPVSYSEVIIPERAYWHPYTWKMRGNDKNDLFLAGEYGAAYHFNGKHWRWYSELRNDGLRFWCLDTSPNLSVIGGEDNSGFLTKGIVVIGRR